MKKVTWDCYNDFPENVRCQTLRCARPPPHSNPVAHHVSLQAVGVCLVKQNLDLYMGVHSLYTIGSLDECLRKNYLLTTGKDRECYLLLLYFAFPFPLRLALMLTPSFSNTPHTTPQVIVVFYEHLKTQSWSMPVDKDMLQPFVVSIFR